MLSQHHHDHHHHHRGLVTVDAAKRSVSLPVSLGSGVAKQGLGRRRDRRGYRATARTRRVNRTDSGGRVVVERRPRICRSRLEWAAQKPMPGPARDLRRDIMRIAKAPVVMALASVLALSLAASAGAGTLTTPALFMGGATAQ